MVQTRSPGSIGESLFVPVVAPEPDMRPVGMEAFVGGEHFNERRGRDRLGRGGKRCVLKRDGLLPSHGRRGAHGTDEVAQRFRLADEPIGQFDAEGPIETQQDFGPREAIEAEIAIELAVEPDRQGAGKMRVEFERQIAARRHDPHGDVVPLLGWAIQRHHQPRFVLSAQSTQAPLSL
jgi:hypothetical protein